MEFPVKKIIIAVIIIIVVGIGVFIYFRSIGEKNLRVVSPNGGEILRAGQTYQITWKARKIGKVGIMLIKGEENKESKWIAKDISAGKKSYNWQVFTWEAPGQDYKIALLEYPWQEGNFYDYSDETFTIIGPKFASCDILSTEAEWPFIPSDFPNLRKVFITKEEWPGNLGGLEGADQKCQEEAEKIGLKGGTWKAFLGDDTTFATDRLKLEGIFVEATSSTILPEGKTCYRLYGKNFNEFFKKLSEPLAINQEKFDEDFLNDLGNIWLGRINNESKKDCIAIFSTSPYYDPTKNYTFTTTCQNWTTDRGAVAGYPPEPNKTVEFPACYTPQGVRVDAVKLGGLGSGLLGKEREGEIPTFTSSLGKSCSLSQKLLCIEQ